MKTVFIRRFSLPFLIGILENDCIDIKWQSDIFKCRAEGDMDYYLTHSAIYDIEYNINFEEVMGGICLDVL